ncbi:MAG: zinc-dependent peptidase [Phycisphaeraceae bacterium]|nr:zinc-dependent peptidase [Phycisphaeraceae bacterium]
MFGYFRNKRRKRLRNTPLPGAWWDIIDENVPLVRGMDKPDRKELGGIIQILIHEKTFEGCGGLEITDTIRLTILAQAAVLLLNRDTGYYPTLKTILVYPSTYFANHQEVLPDGTVVEGKQARLGESWYRGSLVLAWDNVQSSAWNHDDGRNVTLHEFAHQLDGVATGMDGAPDLNCSERYRSWARVLGDEYATLSEKLHKGHKTKLDPYAATNPPEFFAVATEYFFEKPGMMRRHYPELYDELAAFYKQDRAGD